MPAPDLGPAIDVAPLRGKTIYSIPIDSKAEFYQAGEQAMKDVATKAGVDFVTFPSDGTQISYQQGINQAINAGAAATCSMARCRQLSARRSTPPPRPASRWSHCTSPTRTAQLLQG